MNVILRRKRVTKPKGPKKGAPTIKETDYDTFKNRLKNLLTKQGLEKYIKVLELTYPNGTPIFNLEDKDVAFQLIFSLKNQPEKTFEYLSSGNFKDSEKLYYGLDIFNKSKAFISTEQSNDFYVRKIHSSGIKCESQKCGAAFVELLDRGPTSGDEASRSVYQCPLCGWKKFA